MLKISNSINSDMNINNCFIRICLPLVSLQHCLEVNTTIQKSILIYIKRNKAKYIKRNKAKKRLPVTLTNIYFEVNII